VKTTFSARTGPADAERVTGPTAPGRASAQVAEVVGTHTIDKHLTDVERTLQLKETKADISYFKRSYERADLHVTITGLGSEASAAAIDARLGST
jgi:hypothetical protein